MAKSLDPPKEAQEILDKDYSYLNDYGPQVWLAELTRLYDLSVHHNLGLHEVDPNTYTFGEVGESGEASELMTVQAAIPTVQFIEANSEGFWIPPNRLPAVLVDAHALDKVSFEQFMSTLKDLRDRFPPPVARPGPWAPNTSIDQDTFLHWIDWRIVQLADLLVWREELGGGRAGPFRDWAMGVWMWGDEVEPKKISEATDKLKLAIACRHMLMSQITHESPPPQVTEQMIWSEVLKRMTCTQNALGELEVSLPQTLEFLAVQEIKPRD